MYTIITLFAGVLADFPRLFSASFVTVVSPLLFCVTVPSAVCVDCFFLAVAVFDFCQRPVYIAVDEYNGENESRSFRLRAFLYGNTNLGNFSCFSRSHILQLFGYRVNFCCSPWVVSGNA